MGERPLHACLAVVVCLTAAVSKAETARVTQQLAAQIAPIAKVATPLSITLIGVGQTFLPFTASMPVSYRARTRPGVPGLITMQVSAFSPLGGPSVSAGALTYTCSGATLGSGCGSETARSDAQTPVVTIQPSACTGGGGPCSPTDPNTVRINFVLENSPAYQTGTYSAQVTLTISSI